MKMAKIVYNACYGGFSLSRTAVLRAREISGNPEWGGACIRGDIDKWDNVLDADYGSLDDMPRHDPVLVQVVEELGDEASGDCARLAIAEILSGSLYRIDEYDGNEMVCTRDDYEWETAP